MDAPVIEEAFKADGNRYASFETLRVRVGCEIVGTIQRCDPEPSRLNGHRKPRDVWFAWRGLGLGKSEHLGSAFTQNDAIAAVVKAIG